MKIRLNPMSSPAFCGDLTFAAASADSAAAEVPADESAPIVHWRHRHHHRHYHQRGC